MTAHWGCKLGHSSTQTPPVYSAGSPGDIHNRAANGGSGESASAAPPAPSTPPAASTEGLSSPAADANPASESSSEWAQGQGGDHTGGSSHKQHAVADAAASEPQDQPAAANSGEPHSPVAGTTAATEDNQKQPLQAVEGAAIGAEQAAAAGTAAESRQEQTPAQTHQAAGGRDAKRKPRKRPPRKAPAQKEFVQKVRGIREEVCVHLCCCPGGARQAEMVLPVWRSEKGVCGGVIRHKACRNNVSSLLCLQLRCSDWHCSPHLVMSLKLDEERHKRQVDNCWRNGCTCALAARPHRGKLHTWPLDDWKGITFCLRTEVPAKLLSPQHQSISSSQCMTWPPRQRLLGHGKTALCGWVDLRPLPEGRSFSDHCEAHLPLRALCSLADPARHFACCIAWSSPLKRWGSCGRASLW